jgi:bacterioferritin-associated ferredoxin
MYVCLCKGITDRQIREAIEDGTTTLRGLSSQLGCSTQCGRCKPQVREIRNAVLVELQPAMTPALALS